MSQRARVSLAVAAVVVIGLASLWIRARIGSRPDLNEITALAASGRLGAAERALEKVLVHDPKNPGANLLAAQVAMGRIEAMTQSGLAADPGRPSAALDHLNRVDSAPPKLMAQVWLWRGKADRVLGLLDEAEASWLEALRLDPTVPEAGWLLLQEYYLQLRPAEARSLALRLHAVEPDPRDRVLFLLESFRQDVMPPAPASLVIWFEPIAARHPEGFRANLALGRALVRSSELDRGLTLLRKLAEAHPEQPDAWDALLGGLDEVGESEELARVVEALPQALAGLPRFLKYRAKLAEDRGGWKAAADAYRRAIEADPADYRLGYRLARVLQRLGDRAEADRLHTEHRAREALNQEARDFYQSRLADLPPGVPPAPDLYDAIASLRERMGFPEEAAAWRRLAGLPTQAGENSDFRK